MRRLLLLLPLVVASGLGACSGAETTVGGGAVDAPDGASGVSGDQDAAVDPPPSPIDGGDGGDGGDATDAGDASAEAATDAGPDATPIAVDGYAHYMYFDAPLTGAKVKIAGVEKTVGAAGAFSFTNVVPPYDVTATYTLSVNNAAIFDSWKGLSSSSPKLEGGYPILGTPYTAEVSGELKGIGDTIDASSIVRVFSRTRYGNVAIATLYPGAPTKYKLNPQWYDASTRDVVVYAILQKPNTGYPEGFAFGMAKTTLTSGQPASLDITMTDPMTVTLDGTITPVSFTGQLAVGVRFGEAKDDGAMTWWTTPATTPFSLLAPKLPGAKLVVEAYKTLPGGGGSYSRKWELPAGQSYSLGELAKPTAVTPAAGATYAPGMTFSWTPAAGATGGVYVFRFALNGSSPAPLFRERTTATSVTLPAAFAPKPASTYAWDVVWYPNAKSVDDLATGDSYMDSRVEGTGGTVAVP